MSAASRWPAHVAPDCADRLLPSPVPLLVSSGPFGCAVAQSRACTAARPCSAGPMLERWVQLAVEIAKWEAEEKERQRREDMRAARQQTGLPRPLMIRTGKAKTDGEASAAAVLCRHAASSCCCLSAARNMQHCAG